LITVHCQFDWFRVSSFIGFTARAPLPFSFAALFAAAIRRRVVAVNLQKW
jgi:hypothetical protein